MSRGFSPLERRALLALVSLIRDREPEPEEWTITDFPLRALYDATIVMDPAGSYELQRRNHRQAMRRALGRLHERGFVSALALGWCEVGTGEFIEWQGGGKRQRKPDDCNPRGWPTANWRLVGLTSDGIALALLLERETKE
jgi:hypothetical protein